MNLTLEEAAEILGVETEELQALDEEALEEVLARLKQALSHLLPGGREKMRAGLRQRVARGGKGAADPTAKLAQRRADIAKVQAMRAKEQSAAKQSKEVEKALGPGRNPKRVPYLMPGRMTRKAAVGSSAARRKYAEAAEDIINSLMEAEVMDWSAVANRMRAIVEEIEGVSDDEDLEGQEGQETVGEAEEGSDEEEVVEAFSDDELVMVAEMLQVEAEDLLGADEEDLAQALGEMAYKVMAHPKYGRPGLHKSRHPWSKNEKPVGKASAHASPTRTGLPSHGSAKVPKQSSAPYARKPRKMA